MNTTSRVSDSALRDALATRVADAESRTLAADVLSSVTAIPQGRRWVLGIGRSGSLFTVLVGIALLMAVLVGAAIVGARLLRDLAGTSGAIAFTSANWGWDSGVTADELAIFAVPAAGGAPHHLAYVPTDTLAVAPEPTSTAERLQIGPQVRWSPDGSKIAFRLNGDPPGLYVMNRDGSDLRRAAEAAGDRSVGTEECCSSSFAWSPDGSRIAFISPAHPPWPPGSAPNGRLYVLDVDTVEVRQVAVAANGSLAWSPDGTRIAFGRSQPWQSDLVVINADGMDEQALRFSQPEFEVNHPGPIAWSPDGSKIGFLQARFGAGSDLYVMVVDRDLTEPRELAHWPSGCCVHGAFGGVLEWSPDGNWIATRSWSEDPRVFLIDAEATGGQLSVVGDWFDWSPDGSQLVVAAPGPAIPGAPDGYRSSSIFVVNADGTDRRWIADGDYPAWSP